VEYKAGPIEEPHDDLPNANGKVITDLMYRHWDTWEDEKYSNIFVATYHDGALTSGPKNIMNEPYDTPLQPFDGMEDISWDAGGARIAYTCKKSAGREYTLSTDSDIYLYDLSSGETKNITEGMPGYDKEPVFSPNGRYLAWNSMARAGFESDRNRIFLMDLQTGEKHELTAGLNRDASHPKWSRNSNTVFFTVGENATYQIASIEVATGEFRMITEGTHNYNDIRVAGPAYLVGARTSMSMPQEIYRINLLSGGQKQVSFINEPILKKVKMGDVKPRWVMTTDSMHMLVWMIYPPDFDPTMKYPTLLYCQGGPQSAVSQFWSYRWNFQLMAANDYIIVAPNRRGLPSFGRQWNDQISGDWGGQAMNDYLSAIDNAMQEPYVDTSNVGAVGASFGGYSVYWLAGNHDKRFSAFVSHCGLFNLESWYGTTEEMFFANWDLGGPYWDSTYHEEYEKFSPHTYVENWDTPMLVIHGENDFRVPVSEGIQAFHAAQLRGIPSRFLYYPDEGHWVLKPQNGLMWHREYFNWLDKWLKNEPRS
jgi:dipeptidyl aminopeptidase/acylaminoacyl peptidase